MRMRALLLTCMAVITLGRRVQQHSQQLDDTLSRCLSGAGLMQLQSCRKIRSPKPLKALATLLAACNPSSGWQSVSVQNWSVERCSKPALRHCRLQGRCEQSAERKVFVQAAATRSPSSDARTLLRAANTAYRVPCPRLAAKPPLISGGFRDGVYSSFTTSRSIWRKKSSQLSRFLKNSPAGRFLANGVPRLSTLSVHKTMMGLLVLAYGFQTYAPQPAMLAGARVNAAIINGGQWHRLFSPVFLHGGFMHLISNMFSIWRMGPLVEEAYGKSRTLLVYLAAGVCGNLAGLWFGDARRISIGASGAAFGLMGAICGFVYRNKGRLGGYGDMLMQSMGQTLLLNLLWGMRAQGIDNLAHVGGFIGGAALGTLVAPKSGYGQLASNEFLMTGKRSSNGAMISEKGVRWMLTALCVAYAIGLQTALWMALQMIHFYGRK